MNDDRISELYKGEIWSEALQQRAQRRIHWLCSQAAGDTVLDVGCSQGIAAILLGREGFEVTGIDIQPSRIEYALADLEEEPADVRSRVHFAVANGSALEFDEGTFDSVLLGEVIEHLAVPRRLLEEIRRVLKPGGRIVVTTPFGRSPHHDHKQTFYPNGVLDVISEVFAPASILIEDRYFRIVATKPVSGDSAQDVHPTAILAALDGVFAELEASRAIDQVELGSLSEKLATTRSELATTRSELATTRSELEGEKRDKLDERNKRVEAERGASEAKAATLKERTSRIQASAELEDLRVESDRQSTELIATIAKERGALRQLRNSSAAAKNSAAASDRALRTRVSNLERDRWKLRSRLDVAQWKTRSLGQRKWTRLGAAIGKVRSNPFRIFILPFDLVSIMFSHSTLPPRPKPRPKPAPYRAPRSVTSDSAKPSVARTATAQPAADDERFVVPSVERSSVEPTRSLLVATLLDEFSFDLFKHEFHALQVTPDGWESVLAQRPSMLLVESAWRGKDDSWMGQIAKERGPSDEFRSMVGSFSDAGIPTVFWNKEDPPNYRLYIEAARLFDVVFTVCEESIPDYVRDLGHDRVYLLPFSVQPKIHNPTSVGDRANGVAFAGTYYAKKHPERVAQVEAVLDPARDFPFSIFSRVASSGNYKWPDRFEPFIVGSLPYEDVLTAYKMFDVFLNVNSVVESESMCARRIFELAASGTPILSGTSPAINRFFGDVVLQAPDSAAGQLALRALLGSEEMRSRTALLGVRKAMREHTVSLRFDDILERSGVSASRTPPDAAVSLVVPTNRPRQMGHILENVGRQSYSNLQLVVAAHGFDVDEGDLRRQGLEVGLDDIVFVRVEADRTLGEVINAGFSAADGAYIGKIDDDNHYGAEFVGDLMDAFVYTEAGIVGKWTHYTYVEGLDAMVLRFPGFEHTYVELVAGSAMIAERAVFDAVKFPSKRVGEDTAWLRDAKAHGVRTYSADRYNYVYMRYGSASHHTFNVSDVELAAKGELVQYGLNLPHVNV